MQCSLARGAVIETKKLNASITQGVLGIVTSS